MCKECHSTVACSVFIAEAHGNVECQVLHGEKLLSPSKGTMCKQCQQNQACSVFIAEACSNVEWGCRMMKSHCRCR